MLFFQSLFSREISTTVNTGKLGGVAKLVGLPLVALEVAPVHLVDMMVKSYIHCHSLEGPSPLIN